MIPIPPRLVRRVALAPVVLCCCILLVVASPILFVLAAIVDLFAGGRRSLRFVAFGVTYCAYEVAGLLAVFWLWVVSGAGAPIRGPTVSARPSRLIGSWPKGLQPVASPRFPTEVRSE